MFRGRRRENGIHENRETYGAKDEAENGEKREPSSEGAEIGVSGCERDANPDGLVELPLNADRDDHLDRFDFIPVRGFESPAVLEGVLVLQDFCASRGDRCWEELLGVLVDREGLAMLVGDDRKENVLLVRGFFSNLLKGRGVVGRGLRESLSRRSCDVDAAPCGAVPQRPPVQSRYEENENADNEREQQRATENDALPVVFRNHGSTVS